MAVNMLNNAQTDTDTNELNFTAFTDLCRFCSLRHGAKINLFEKEAEQRQILYKVRSFLPIAVSKFWFCCSVKGLDSCEWCVPKSVCIFADIQRRFSSKENMRTLHFTIGTILRMESNMRAKWFSASKLFGFDARCNSDNQFSGTPSTVSNKCHFWGICVQKNEKIILNLLNKNRI